MQNGTGISPIVGVALVPNYSRLLTERTAPENPNEHFERHTTHRVQTN